MGRADYYKPGDWNVRCDQCGMKRKASDCRKTHENLFVCNECFNPQHPQDFVKGLPEDQSVPIARPDIVAAMGSTTVATTAQKNATSIVLASVASVADGDPINIIMDNGAAHSTFCDGTPVGSTVTLGSYLPYLTTSGNVVYLPSVDNETYITATGITGAGL